MSDPIADASDMYDIAMSDICGTLSDREIDIAVRKRTIAERTFMMDFVPVLFAELDIANNTLKKMREEHGRTCVLRNYLSSAPKSAGLSCSVCEILWPEES